MDVRAQTCIFRVAQLADLGSHRYTLNLSFSAFWDLILACRGSETTEAQGGVKL